MRGISNLSRVAEPDPEIPLGIDFADDRTLPNARSDFSLFIFWKVMDQPFWDTYQRHDISNFDLRTQINTLLNSFLPSAQYTGKRHASVDIEDWQLHSLSHYSALLPATSQPLRQTRTGA